MRKTFARLLCLIIFMGGILSQLFAQSPADSALAARKAMFQKMEPLMVFPVAKGSALTGAIQVDSVTEDIDAKATYKILFDFTQGSMPAYSKGIVNDGVEEIVRMVNLHRAAGVKPEKLQVVVVVHSAAVLSVLNESAYQQKFNRTNPNAALIRQLQEAGAHFVVCGQTMKLRGLNNFELIPGVKKAFSARTALSTYVGKGFVTFAIADAK